ncbi:Kynurenine formamidase [Exophiala oligosperma]
MKKIIRYLQDQAVKASEQKYSGSSYLSPSTKEPQQRIRHHSPTEYRDARRHSNSHSHSYAHGTAAMMIHDQPEAEATTTTTAERGLSAATTTVAGLDSGGAGEETQARINRNITRHQYGQDNILQSYDVFIPDDDREEEQPGRYWVLFIHGGYFRDTNVTSTSFLPALSKIMTPTSTSTSTPKRSRSIRGYASINYRLSPHPNEPQDPDVVSRYEMRDAKWPDHMNDVSAAISHLQTKYGFGDRYLLVGHSVGATMALLATLSPFSPGTGSTASGPNPSPPPPTVVLGVSGIYDFPALHSKFPGYVALTRNAGISSAEDDERASPARYDLGRYRKEWASKVPGRKVGVVLAHSKDDGLVDWGQVEIMNRVLTHADTDTDDNTDTTTVSDDKDEVDNGRQGTTKRVEVKLLEIHGQHSQIWRDGAELVRAIHEGVEMMKRLTDEEAAAPSSSP